MAHERELTPLPTPLPTLQADQGQVDERWPVPYAMMFVTGVSVALWSLLIAAARWLIG